MKGATFGRLPGIPMEIRQVIFMIMRYGRYDKNRSVDAFLRLLQIR